MKYMLKMFCWTHFLDTWITQKLLISYSGCSSRILDLSVHPEFWIWIFFHPGSRIQGSKKPRIRIRNTVTYKVRE